jgi:hypothetical protein
VLGLEGKKRPCEGDHDERLAGVVVGVTGMRQDTRKKLENLTVSESGFLD